MSRYCFLYKPHLLIVLTSKKIAIRHWLHLVFAAVLFSVLDNPAGAEALNKQKITASYLYNFAKNIEWPNESAMTSFDIGVYGSDNPSLFAELSQLKDKVKLRSLPITVSQVNSITSLPKYALIYVEHANNKTISDIYDALEGKPVLLVTADFSNKQLVMINLTTTENDHVHFEVNKSNILNQGLKPLPELILNGGSEIDVAKLFREGQVSLVDVQKKLQGREKTLNELTATIQTQEALNVLLEKQLLELNKNINKSDVLIINQNLQLQNQNEQIEKSKKERLDLLHEVDLRTRELDEQKVYLKKVVAEIDVREKHLAFLNNTIATQESDINNQKEAIAGLDKTVGSQKIALRYSWSLVILGMLLVGTIFIAYTVKRRDNQRLAAHSQDLQIAKDRLAIAKRKAEDASQAKSEFLSLMSHELRTPLQAIIGYSEVVIEELKLEDDQRHINDLMRVISNSERLLKLINGVLDLAKIESGRMELDLTEVKLSSLVDEALSAVAPLFEKNSIQLKVDVNDGAFLPMADPEKLVHILINLLGNASKFSPEGVVTVKAFHEPHRIFMSVADTGIGLSSEQQLHIFDMFRQADSSITRKFQGSGLGLSITRQLCELMGGTIEIDSELGAGATFMVSLPLPITPSHTFGSSTVDVAYDIEVMGNSATEDGLHIVMIDDDPAFLDIMARTMRREGYHVHTAGDAETGMHLVQTIKPQVVTLDLLLPDEHGWLLFEKIKADPELCDIPIIIISIMDERKHSNKRHAEDYLTKPIGRETLKLAVQKLAPNKRLVSGKVSGNDSANE